MFYIENFGLEFLTDTVENAKAFCGAVCSLGKSILGYYGRPYINHEFGWPQFIVRTKPTDDGNFEVVGMDAHLSGVTTWNLCISSSTKAVEDDDPLTRRVMTYKPDDGSGAVMIRLVNADVLPSFLPDDEITVQVVGFPIDIHYYQDEDGYADSQEAVDGKKFLLADGTIFPIGLLTDNEKRSFEDEDQMLIRGTVKSVQNGLVRFGEENGWNFLDVIINTKFGDLEIVHTLEQVNEAEREHIKEGAVVYGAFYLSGDVAIREYKKGYILDEEHNLALLRYTFQEGAPERLRGALSENIEYFSEWVQATFVGIDNIIERFKYVNELNPDRPFFAHFATITDIVEGAEETTHAIGERCIVIAVGEEYNLDSICFMKCDTENKISRIEVTRNPRYRFALDEKKVYDLPFDNDLVEG